ncbi:MAG: TetR/AcrR family transcriptional regulator [Acidimicrobiia bacterium]
MTRVALNEDSIITTSIRLIEQDGPDRFTLRRLGEALGADPTAIYRHFKDKDELLRAVGDRIIAEITVGLPDEPAGWRAVVAEVCVRLRAAHVAQPHLAALVRSGPPMHENEFAVTEVLLRQLRIAGLDTTTAALAYHALIELTVGSAALDAPMAALAPEGRAERYAGWRRAYSSLDERSHPESVATAPHLYVGTAEDRFRYALDRLLDGIEGRSRNVVAADAAP